MRIYTDTMSFAEVLAAHTDASSECSSTRVHGLFHSNHARKRERRHDVEMVGYGARHTRYRNTGKRGASDDMAATWMDWGWFIAVMFRYEPTAIIGQYDGRAHFLESTATRVRHWRTGRRPDPSVANFAREYGAWWPNHLANPTRDPALTESPFVLVDRLCPPRSLVNLRDPKQVTSWLETA